MKLKIERVDLYLKQIRAKNEITLKQVAEATNLSSSYISRIENGSSVPSENALKKLCTLYSIDINEIADIEYTEEKGDELVNINKIIITEDIRFNGKKINSNDKLSIIKFIEILTSIEDETLKKQFIQTIICVGDLVISQI